MGNKGNEKCETDLCVCTPPTLAAPKPAGQGGFTCSRLAAFSSFSRRRTSRRNSSKRLSLSRIFSMLRKRSSLLYLAAKSLNDDFPLSPASSSSFRNSSFRSFSLLRFSRLSSSARSFTYLRGIGD